MNTNTITLPEQFHRDFEAVSQPILENVMEELLEGPGTCSREEFVAQLLMNEFFPHPCDPDLNGNDPTEIMTTEQKKFLVGVASHMGPDWAQALYRAAVFITKVA
jgi:hypothetical protein